MEIIKILLLIALHFIQEGHCFWFQQPEVPEDAHLTTDALITKYGYPVEVHTAETEAGFQLTLHRIPPKESNANKKGPVLLMHGLMGSSADFVVTGPKIALAYLLADEGYDVWLGNTRGNTYARNNSYLNVDWSEFWDYGWQDLGTEDLPTIIDYILEQTSEESLYYVGHSQGTTIFYVMCSEMPEYNNKIKAMVSLGPLAFMSHLHCGSMKLIAIAGDIAKVVTNVLNYNEFHPPNVVLLGQLLCSFQATTKDVCSNWIFLVTGYDSDQLDGEKIQVILHHVPSGGCSRKQLNHYGQLISSGRFRKFDNGAEENMYDYETPEPPDYDLAKVTTPIALIYSPNDCMSAIEDVNTLAEKLPNVILKYEVERKFTHLDFVYGNEARSFIYTKIVEIFSKY